MDEVLGGGLLRGQVYLVRGGSGAGNVTLALQFLLEGAGRAERPLYFSFSRSIKHVSDVADSHRWSLDAIALRTSEIAAPQTIFPPAEIEWPEQFAALTQALAELTPRRIVIDSLPAFMVSEGGASYLPREWPVLRDMFARDGCSVLLLEDRNMGGAFDAAQCDGVIALEQRVLGFGGVRRRLCVDGLQAPYRDGYHDYRIAVDGLTVFPRLAVAEYRRERVQEVVSSGLPVLDELLGGGLDRGSSVLLLGPPGTGKSSVALHVVVAAAARGEPSAVYLFDESVDIAQAHADALGMPLREYVRAGRVRLHAVNPGEQSPGEFVDSVRRAVEEDKVRLVVIDSVGGYRLAMIDEPFVTPQLRELVAYLREKAVLTVLIAPHTGSAADDPVDAGCMDDTLLLFRHYQYAGETRNAVSVFKRRTHAPSRTMRDLSLGPGGIVIGPVVSAHAQAPG